MAREKRLMLLNVGIPTRSLEFNPTKYTLEMSTVYTWNAQVF